MPRKRVKASPVNKRDDVDDDDFFFDDSQSGSGRSPHEPQHRNAANARERARMRVLSKAFCRLKTTLPWVPADTKLSKLDTLRLASSYIAHLRALLHEPRSAHTPPHPLSLAWPFAFQHGGSLSCAISQKWNSNQNDSIRNNNQTKEIRNSGNETFSSEYAENDFDHFDRLSTSEHHDHRNQMQYCNNYSFKENYYDIRNSYPDSLVNNS